MSESSISTIGGKEFKFFSPETHEFDIEEIAHSLSNLCRFTGHVKEFYSVAQHSVLTSYFVPDNMRMCALLHDAGEAFLGDVSSPLKANLEDYKKIEEAVEKAIAKHFGIQYPHPAEVKHADYRLLVTEKRDLLPREIKPKEWAGFKDIKPIDYVIRPMEPKLAKTYFMNRYKELRGSI